MKTMKKIILSTIILLISVSILKSQVTIGSINEPARAALLDMKTKNPGTDNVTVEANKPGGLVLPRVKLVNISTLQPFIAPTVSDWAEQKKVHEGMMVYNLTTNNGFSKGIYVWNGTQWEPSKTSFTLTTSNGLTKSGDNILLGGNLTNNTSLEQGAYTLDFTGGQGKIFMTAVKNNIPSVGSSITPVGVDSRTGELFAMKAENQGPPAKAINYLIYKLTGNGDWVNNFNTQIEARDYTLVIVGSFFKPVSAYGAIDAYANGTSINNVFADTYLYDYSGSSKTPRDTWYLHADYLGSTSTDRSHGTWTIHCLVINHSMLNAHKDNPLTYGGNGGVINIEADYAPFGLR
jgi:hypothetical protein